MSLVKNTGIGKCVMNFFYDLKWDCLEDANYKECVMERWKSVGLWPTEEELIDWAHYYRYNVTEVKSYLGKTTYLILNGKCITRIGTEPLRKDTSEINFLYLTSQGQIVVDARAKKYVERLIDTGTYRCLSSDNSNFYLAFNELD